LKRIKQPTDRVYSFSSPVVHLRIRVAPNMPHVVTDNCHLCRFTDCVAAPSNASTLTRSAPISIPTCASIAAPVSRRARFMPSTKPSICLMISVVGSRSTPIARMPCPWSTQSRIRFPPPPHVAPSLATECGGTATTAAVCHLLRSGTLRSGRYGRGLHTTRGDRSGRAQSLRSMSQSSALARAAFMRRRLCCVPVCQYGWT
jgi:hypothetical protein